MYPWGYRVSGFHPVLSRSEFVSVEIWKNKRDETGMKLKHQMSRAAVGWGIFDQRCFMAQQRSQDAGGVDSISLDGHSETSAYWKGSAAYIRMCPRCGLEQSSVDGKSSNCMCMCLNALCCKPLHGHKRCSLCGAGSGSPEPPKVVTVHVKAKRARVVQW
jgi:hypothetical protein